LLFHAAVTAARVVLAVALAVPIGILAGFLISWSPSVRAAIHPLVEIVRPLPPTALIPFFIIWFGIGITGQIILTGLAVFMVLLVETLGAVGTVPLLYIRAARSLGASNVDLYASIIFPAITPTLVGSVRVAAALGFAVGIAAEFMGAQSGIGYLMMVARRTLNTDTIFLGILVIAGQSYLLDSLIRRAGASLCRWKDFSAVLLTNQIG